MQMLRPRVPPSAGPEMNAVGGYIGCPFGDVADDVKKPVTVRLVSLDRSGNGAVLAIPTVFRLAVLDLVTPRIACVRPSTSSTFPLVPAGQPSSRPFAVALGFLPRDLDHRMIRKIPFVVVVRWAGHLA